MKTIFLKDPHYISVPDKTTFSYGGNQQWFPRIKPFGIDARLSRFGCGNIALCDLSLYLTRQSDIRTKETDVAESPQSPLTKDSYLTFAKLMNRRYTFTIPFCGCTGMSLTVSLNHFFLRRHMPYRAHYLWLNTRTRMLSIIHDCLSKDLPIILAIGPNFPNFLGKHGIKFYVFDCKKAPGKKINLLPSANQQVHAHYVTITGIFYNSTTHPILSISSWGKQYYISYQELRNYIRKHGLFLTSSLIYVCPVKV